ncbi:MAG: ribosome small subunit-dependent GTPase A [Bacteroidales bacterium]|nr:ribosome small subunit-dependent GTPase A [Bacteroidales bacterium]
MNLEDLGYTHIKSAIENREDLDGFEIGRIMAEHKERYIVGTDNGEIEAEITGKMRFTATNREDFPAVGDWVALISYDAGSAFINEVLPRYSTIKRQAVAQYGEVQIIGANIDYAFVMQSVDRDFNINRMERYLTICYSSQVKPIIVLTKTDLISKQELSDLLQKVQQRIEDVKLVAISNENQNGYDELIQCIEKGKTYCLLGSSGVGKSSLLNNLSGKSVMKTDSISASTNKGRHVSTHRELKVLGNGGILIDNPGMREVGMAGVASGLGTTYDKIAEFSQYCQFADCTHTNEVGCAVIEAVENGEIDESSYQNYLKLEKENAHYESTVHEKRKKDKALSKIVKNYKKDKKRNNL